MALPIWTTPASLGSVFEDDNLLSDLDATNTTTYEMVITGTKSVGNSGAATIEDLGTKTITINSIDIQLGSTSAAQIDSSTKFITDTEDVNIIPGRTFRVIDLNGEDVVTTKIIQNGSTAPTFPLTGNILLGTSLTSTSLSLTGVADIESLVSTLNTTFDTGTYGVRASANILTQSEEINHVDWNKTNSSISANAIASPNGTITADKLMEDADSAQIHHVNQNFSALTTDHRASVFVKAGERSRIQIALLGGTTQVGLGFDLSSGSTFTETLAGIGTTSGAIEELSDGWYRCSLIGGAGGITQFRIYLDNGTDETYDGDGASGVYLWGAQVEQGTIATDYIQTVATADILRLTKDNSNGGTDLLIDTSAITVGDLQLTDNIYYLGLQQIADNVNNLSVKLTNNITASVQTVTDGKFLRLADSVTGIAIQDNNSSIVSILNFVEFSSISEIDLLFELNAQMGTTGVVAYILDTGEIVLIGPSVLLDVDNYSFDLLELLGLDKAGSALLTSPITEWLTVDETLGVLQGTTPFVEITTPVSTTIRAANESGIWFNGTTSYVAFGDNHDFAGTLPFTVELYFRWDGSAAGSFPGLITKEVFSTRDGWGLNIDTDTSTISFRRYLTDVADRAFGSIVVGQKYHVAATYDGTNMRLYLDGVLVDTTISSKSLTDNISALELGRVVSGNYFVGIIDEVRIWDFARTASEILADINATLVGTESAPSHNLLTYAEEFDHADWIKTDTTVTANATTAFDGTVTADKIEETATTADHKVHQNYAGFTLGQEYVWSLYVEAAERSWLRVQFGGTAFPTNSYAFFDVTTGVTGTIGSGLTASDYGIENVGGGIFRCWIKQTADVTASDQVSCYLATADNTFSYLGVVTNGLYLWGGQLENFSALRIYRSTAANAVPTTASITGYWKLDENTGATTADTTVGAITGTLNNNNWVPGLIYADRTFTFNIQPLDLSGQISWTTGLLGTFDEGDIAETNITVQNLDAIADEADFYALKETKFDFSKGEISPFILTRNTTATKITAGGTVTTVGIDQPVFEYDFLTKEFKGLRIEPERTNILNYSEQFDNAYWTKSNASITPDSNISPNVSHVADSLIENDTNSDHYIQKATITVPSNVNYTFSCFIKDAGRDDLFLTIYDSDTANRVQGRFILTTLVHTPTNFGTASGATTEMISLADGWYKCIISGIPASVDSGSLFAVRIQMINVSSTYLGDGVSGLHLWGAQLEQGSFLTSYIPTTTSPVTRQADDVNIELFDLDYVITTEGTSIDKSNVTVVNRNYNLQLPTNEIYVKNVTINKYHQEFLLNDVELQIDNDGHIGGTYPFHNETTSKTYNFESILVYKDTLLLGPDDFSILVSSAFTNIKYDVSVPLKLSDADRSRWNEISAIIFPTEELYRRYDPNFGTVDPHINLVSGLQIDTLINYASSVQGQFDSFDVHIGDVNYAETSNFDIVYYEISDLGSIIENYNNPIAGISPSLIEPESLTILRDKLIDDIGFEVSEDLPAWQTSWSPIIVLGYVDAGQGQSVVDTFNDDDELQEFIGTKVSVDRIDLLKKDFQKHEIANTDTVIASLDFAGASTDEITFDELTVNETMTIEAWVSTIKTSDESMIIYWAKETGGNGFGTENETHLGFNAAGNIKLFSRTGDVDHFTLNSTASTYEDGTLYHIAAVIDNSAGAVEIFVNGISDGSTTFTAGAIDFSAYTFMKIGGPDSGTTRWWDGIIDDVRIWNYARAQADINFYKDKELFGDEFGLIGYWKFNEGIGTIVYDSSNRNNDGIINGTIDWDTVNVPTMTVTPHRTVDKIHSIGIMQKTNTTTTNLYSSVPDYILDYQFAGATSLANARKWGQADITFTRSSVATYFDQYGVMRTAAIDEPRFDHNPVSGTALGLLIEEQRENLVLNNDDILNQWTFARFTGVKNVTGPDSVSNSAVTYTETADTNTHKLQCDADTFTSGVDVSYYAIVKKGTEQYVELSIDDNSAGIIFDFDAAAISATDGTLVDSGVKDWGDGWYLIWFVNNQALTAQKLELRGNTDGTTFVENYLGVTSKTRIVYAMQAEEGAFPTSYIPTTAAVTRSADVASVSDLSWHNATAGTWFVQCRRSQKQTGAPAFVLYMESEALASDLPKQTIFGDGTNDRIRTQITPISGGDSGELNLGSEPLDANNKIAIAYALNDMAGSFNGAAVVTDSSVDVDVGYDEFHIGSADNSLWWNGHIQAIRYWPVRRSNTQLQSDTS